jgi:cation diffusion facilitator CzcD-associated flavoprotein CzcO
MTTQTMSGIDTYDVVVIGAGISGMYALIRLRALGFRARVFEAGSDVGGTWYWNRYPGARFDSESYSYAFSFDPELLEEWNWSEHFAAQPETHRYLRRVAEKYDLRRDIEFNTRIAAAEFQESDSTWIVTTEAGRQVRSRFVLTAIGILSAPYFPPIPGRDRFKGRSWHTSHWPKEPVDLGDQRVAVIGTGATAVQLITEIAKNVGQLTVFQRTANYTKPLRNQPIRDEEQRALKDRYPEIFGRCKQTFGAFIHDIDPRSIFELEPEAQRQHLERLWNEPGFGFWLGNFMDTFTDRKACEIVSAFVREKIRERVKDPAVADKLVPTDHPFGTKRVPLESGYYEAFNRVDIKKHPIQRITETGLETSERSYDVDIIVYATGFDAVTGAFGRITIRGRNGELLKDKWAEGPQTLLGLQIAGFPNLFTIVGPHNSAAFCNIPRCIEQNVDWVCSAIAHLRTVRRNSIEATLEAESEWTAHVNEQVGQMLIGQTDSWFMGSNIPGKKRGFLAYFGGAPAYRLRCAQSVANGYEGFRIS